MKIKNIYKDILILSAAALGLVALYWQILVTNKSMASHDSIIWYGVFSYFADCLRHGFLPLWNPYMNCGEPFFLNVYVLHLLDPQTLFLILAGNFFKINPLTLYHYDLIMRYMIFVFGSYFFFKHAAKRRISAVMAFVTLTFSSLAVSYLRQHAFILAFYLLPWLLLFILKYLEERDSKYLICIAFFIGITSLSYHAMFTISGIGILLISLFLSGGLQRLKFKKFFQSRRDYFIVSAAVFVFALLVINVLPVFLAYTRDVVPTARIFESPYPARSYPADFFNLITPYWFVLHFFNWTYMSESFLYIGLIPLIFSVIGILFSRHRYRTGFIITTIVTLALMLGNNIICKMFQSFFPLFTIIRNTHTYSPFLIFCMSYFVCIGADEIFGSIHKPKMKLYGMCMAFFSAIILLVAVFFNHYYINNPALLIKGPWSILHGYISLIKFPEIIPVFQSAHWNTFNSIRLFVVSVLVIFLVLRNKKIRMSVKYFAVIFLVFIDIFSFCFTGQKFFTMPRQDMASISSDKFVYSESRVPKMYPVYPFYAFIPAITKTFTAYSTRIPDVTTHFYQAKTFFDFTESKSIPVDVKKDLMGIAGSRFRLIDKAEVLSRERIEEELAKINLKSTGRIVFIEEKLPVKYSYLEALPGGANKKEDPVHGSVEVQGFGPNEIVINVRADKDCFLFYGDCFDRAWKAYVDGVERKVYRTDLTFKSVLVDSGNHSVRFVYDPKFYKFTIACYIAGILILFVAAVYAIVLNLKRGK